MMLNMMSEKKKLKQCPFGTLAFRRLWQCSTTSAKGRKIQQDRRKSKQSPIENGRRLISTLKRCSTNHPSKSAKEDTTFSQSEETVVGKTNTSSLSAAHRKVGDEDTPLSQPGKTMNAKLNPRPLFADVPRQVYPHSRELIKRLGKCGVLRRVLSPRAAKLYKDGMPLSLAVRSVGTRNAFTPWRDGASICVKLRANGGQLSISKA